MTNQCCNAEIGGGGGWGVFNSLFGWQNSATIGSVVSYNLYWIAVTIGYALMGYVEKTGHWPLMKAKSRSGRKGSDDKSEEAAGVVYSQKEIDEKRVQTSVSSATT